MSSMSRSFRVCSPLRIPCPRRPDQNLLVPRLTGHTNIHPVLAIRRFSRMPVQRLPSPAEEPNAKRRKTVTSEPRFVRSSSNMASQANLNPKTLELTEEETRLRDLLLAVATYIDEQPSAEATASGVAVPEEVAQEKIVLRWTGGWVRDKLLGVGSQDVDVAINKMTGENFGLKMLEYLKIPGNLEKHAFNASESDRIMSGLHTIKANPEASKNLETATIKVMGIDLDLVNLRKETYDEISRNPQMEFGTAEEDAMRRDATVNAMFYNLNTQEIEDFTGLGFKDMADKIIRTPLEPYQTFKDDPLRVLRLIRFASRLNYTLDPKTAEAMANKDIQEALKIKIKRERVGVEMEKMLRGPDPAMALRLIEEGNLYDTIFTDPTRKLDFQPSIEIFRKAYQLTKSLLRENDNSKPSVLLDVLLSDSKGSDDDYLAWVSAAVMPWADAPKVPPSKKSRQPLHAAYIVAQEGLKVPNRISDVIATSLDNHESITQLVGNCQKPLAKDSRDASAQREEIGMSLRKWGRSWRSQVFFSLLHEIVYGSQSTEDLISQYGNFLTLLVKLDLLDVIDVKPLVNGTQLAKALDVKPGPWMKDALDIVLSWQLRNPSVTDPAEAIAEVKKTSKSELPSQLISHFLTLTIRPLFSQNKTENLDRDDSAPWKSRENSSFLSLLQWCIRAVDGKDLREWFRMIRSPIFRMLEDSDIEWNAKACQVITLLVKKAPTNMKEECRNLFSEDLFRYFNYLPTLTPAQDSAKLLEHVYPALVSFVPVAEERIVSHERETAPTTDINDATINEKDIRFLDKIVRQGAIAVLQHAPTSTTYPDLTTIVLNNLSRLIISLDIECVKHTNDVLVILHDILRDKFSPAHPELLLSAIHCLRTLISKGWPRMDIDRLKEIYVFIAMAWVNCSEYEDMSTPKNELQVAVLHIDRVFCKDGQDERLAKWWTREKERTKKENLPWVGVLAHI